MPLGICHKSPEAGRKLDLVTSVSLRLLHHSLCMQGKVHWPEYVLYKGNWLHYFRAAISGIIPVEWVFPGWGSV